MTQILITSSALILIMVLARLALRKRVSQRLIYGLWLLVALRLLIPVQFGQSKYSVTTAVQPAVEQVQQVVQRPIAGPSREEIYDQLLQDYLAQTPSVPQAPVVPEVTAPAPTVSVQIQTQLRQEAEEKVTAPSVSQILTGIWLAGMSAMAVWFLAANLLFLRKIRKDSERLTACQCKSAEVRGDIPLFAGAIHESPAVPYRFFGRFVNRPYGKKGMIRLRLCPHLDSPCLVGFFRPTVCLTPATMENEETLRHVLTHETTHLRHGDHIWSVVRCICLCIYWFNPLVWLAAILSKRDQELACDEAALLKLGEEERIPYGKTLLNIVVHANTPGRILQTATAMSETKKQLKERIVFIVKRPKNLWFAAISLILIAAIATGCAFTGSKPPIVQTTQGTESADPPPATQATEPTQPTTAPADNTGPATEPTRPSEPVPPDIPDTSGEPLRTMSLAKEHFGISYVEFLYAGNAIVSKMTNGYVLAAKEAALRDTAAMAQRILRQEEDKIIMHFPVFSGETAYADLAGWFSREFFLPEGDFREEAYSWFLNDLAELDCDYDAYGEMLLLAVFQTPDTFLEHLSRKRETEISEIAVLLSRQLDAGEYESYAALLNAMEAQNQGNEAALTAIGKLRYVIPDPQYREPAPVNPQDAAALEIAENILDKYWAYRWTNCCCEMEWNDEDLSRFLTEAQKEEYHGLQYRITCCHTSQEVWAHVEQYLGPDVIDGNAEDLLFTDDRGDLYVMVREIGEGGLYHHQILSCSDTEIRLSACYLYDDDTCDNCQIYTFEKENGSFRLTQVQWDNTLQDYDQPVVLEEGQRYSVVQDNALSYRCLIYNAQGEITREIRSAAHRPAVKYITDTLMEIRVAPGGQWTQSYFYDTHRNLASAPYPNVFFCDGEIVAYYEYGEVKIKGLFHHAEVSCTMRTDFVEDRFPILHAELTEDGKYLQITYLCNSYGKPIIASEVVLLVR